MPSVRVIRATRHVPNRAAGARNAGSPGWIRALTIVAAIALGILAGASPVAAAPDFQLTVSPKTVFLSATGSVHLTVGAAGLDGFTSPLTLKAMGLPTGVTAAFNPNPLTLPGTSDLTLTAGAGLVATEFNVNIAATGGGITHFAMSDASVLDFALTPVEPPPCRGSFEGILTNSETGARITNTFYRVGPSIGTTDANGHYGPTQSDPGDTQFSAFSVPGYWDSGYKPITIVCNQTTQLDFALLPWHPATVFGKVVEGTPSAADSTVIIPTTTPVSGINVRLEGDINSTGGPSAADGSYTTTVPSLGLNNTSLTNVRIFPVQAGAKGYWPRSSIFPSPIPIGDLAPFENKNVDIALVRQCTGKISGNVTYGDTGAPAAGINVHSGHRYAGHDVVTDANGDYSIDKALLGYNNIPVDHDLTAFATFGHPRAFYYYSSNPAKTHLDACGAERVVDLVLPPVPMGHIEGHVYDDNGAPVAGAPFGIDSLSCRPCLPSNEGKTDADGYYRIADIPAPSEWPVRYFDQFKTPYWDSPAEMVSVKAGLTTLHDIHIVAKKFAQVRGVVSDAVTGAPIGDAFVAESEDAFMTTAADGKYQLGPIGLSGPPSDPPNSPRTTSINVDAAHYWPDESEITVAADQPPYTRDVELVPLCQDAVVEGTVRSAVTGAAIPFATLFTDGGVGTTADETGRYRFDHLEVGSKNSPTEVTITANARDYQAQERSVEIFCGAKVFIGSPSTIIIDKATDPNGDPTEFAFSGELGAFTLVDGGSRTFSGLFPGTYDIAEASAAGWRLRDVTCGDETIEPSDDEPVSIHVDAGQTLRCTFSNGRLGTLVVKKETDPDGDTTPFQFFGPEDDFTLADGQSKTFSLAPGSHFVSEQPEGAWDVESSICDDDDSGSDPDLGLADVTVNLAAGETVTCTFTNKRVPTGTIVIKKETDPDGNATVFDFSGPEGYFSLADGESLSMAGLRTDAYPITESLVDGWLVDRVACDDDDSNVDPDSPETAIVQLAADETVTCTFYNRRLPPETGTIIIAKTTTSAGDTTLFPFTSPELGDFEVAGGDTQSFDALTPGLYAVGETGVTGWSLETATCDDGSPVEAIDLEAGETVTCTFHNARETATGTIVVAKTTDPTTSAATFEFTGDLGAFSLGHGATHTASDIPVGSYAIAETELAGWDLASATCSDGSTIDAVDLDAGETVTCTFHNVQRGQLRIRKVGVGGSGNFDYTTQSAGAQGIVGLVTGATSAAQSVPPGDYVFTETAVAGWDVTGVACDDSRSARPSSGNASARTATFAIEAGESVTCTYTNTKRGTLTIAKETDPAVDPQDFAYTTTGDGLSAFSLDTEAGEATLPASRSFVLVPRAYSVTETLPVAGWDFTRVACVSASGSSTVPAPSTTSAAVSITLAAGDQVTCTYRNTKRARFGVIKTVAGVPPSGTQVFDFEVRTGASPTGIGTTLGTGQARAGNGGIVSIATVGDPTKPLLVKPGTYQFCEFILPGWGNPLGATSFVPGIATDSTIDNAFQCVNLTVGAGVNQTYTLDNRPPPGGQAKTIGFWKNWASCASSKGKQKPVLDETLATISGGIPVGKIAVTTCAVAVDLLNKSTIADPAKVGDGKKMSSDPAFNFAAQYIAFRLDIAAGAKGGCTAANDASAAGQAILLAVAFDGQTHAKLSKQDAARLTDAAAILDKYNNNTLAC
jgi:hypothetical protein